MSKKYTFREITEKVELEKLFRLRYQVYVNSELAPFLKVNKYQMDIDVYDLHSRHFGIYCNGELAAGVRAVIDKKDYYNQVVYEIGHEYNFFNEEIHTQAKLINSDYADFPFLSYTGIPEEIKRFYEDQRKDKKVFMSSRCIIDENYRGLKTVQFLTESIITIGNLFCGEKAGIGFTDVNLSHSGFYCRYGFSPIKDAPKYTVNGITLTCLAMYLSTNYDLSSVPQHLHSKFGAMAKEFTSTGKIEREI